MSNTLNLVIPEECTLRNYDTREKVGNRKLDACALKWFVLF